VSPFGYVVRLGREARPDFSAWRGAPLRQEALAGVVCAFLVIPQAITFAYLAGLPPEFGLHSAVFVVFFASLLGTTPMLGGPNTAMSILLAATLLPFAGRGSPLYIEYILLLTLLVGIIQFLFWLFRGAVLFRYFSPAAISGIKTGVGILLIASAVEGALGLAPITTPFVHEKLYVAVVSWGELANPYAVAVSGITVVAGLLIRRRDPRLSIVGAVLIGGLVGGIVEGLLGPIRTDLELLGRIPLELLPLRLPSFTHEHLLVMEQVLPSAVALAVLGLSQSLVIAQDLKSEFGGPVELHREVFAQAVSNMAAPFFSCFAGSGSFNRTMVAIESGGRTSLTGLFSTLAVIIVSWTLGPALTYVPMATIAGVVVLVGIGMIKMRDIRRFLRVPVDGTIFVLTVLAIAFLGLKVGIAVAALSSLGFFVAGASELRFVISRDGDRERIQVNGNLFFASLDGLARHLGDHPTNRSLLDLTGVPYTDSAAQAMLERVGRERAHAGGELEVVRSA
jgi:SulP family sulfate permease